MICKGLAVDDPWQTVISEAWGSLSCPWMCGLVGAKGPFGQFSIIVAMVIENRIAKTVAIFICSGHFTAEPRNDLRMNNEE